MKRTPIGIGHAVVLAIITLAIIATVYLIVAYASAGAWYLPYGVGR